jgi:protein-S-isoprenylcysteine O-methyltransferase Ste14
MNFEPIFRGIFLFVFLSAVIISGYYRKRARDASGVIPRSAEGPQTLILRLVAALTVAVSFFAYAFAPHGLAWSTMGLPLWLRSLAAVGAIACLAAIRWVLVSIGSNISETLLTKHDHHLVTHGPYRWIRHPLYSVALLLLLLLALLADSWFLLIFPLVGFFVFRWIVIPREEANLIKVFGEQYEAYRRRTGALFPRLQTQM